MIYPTLEQIEKADRFNICYWYRHLPSPGIRYIDSKNFNEMIEEELKLMNKIVEKFKEFGGFTPEISKKIGW